MNCYPIEVHLPDFEDLVYEGQHLANLVVSHQVEHVYLSTAPVQTPLDARPGLGTQLRCEALGDLRIEHVKTQSLTSGE